MTRHLHEGISDQHKASLQRQKDARALFESGRWLGAMYMLGYAVECRLKAKLMEKYGVLTLEQLEDALSRRYDKKIDLKVHNLEQLFDPLDVRERLIGHDGSRRNLRAFQQCARWNVAWRYNPNEGEKQVCVDFFNAVDQFLSFLAHHG